MKFSERTLTILKNFHSINQSLVFYPGTTLQTVNPLKTVFATATIADEIPATACVYDMSRFLSVYGLYEEPEVEFEDKNFVIAEGKRRTKYTYAEPSMVHAPERDKNVSLPSVEVEVDVPWSELEGVIKASNVLQLPDIAFVGEGGTIYLRAINSEDPNADTYGVELGETTDTFSLVMKTAYLKVLQGDYKVSLCAKGLTHFKGEDVDYFIAMDSKKSKYRKGE